MLENIRAGIEAGKREIHRGNAVIIPHLDYSLFLTGGPNPTLAQIQRNSMEQMRRCDKVLFLPGCETSKGCQAEKLKQTVGDGHRNQGEGEMNYDEFVEYKKSHFWRTGLRYSAVTAWMP